MRPDPEFAPPAAQPFPGRDPSGPRYDPDAPWQFRRQRDRALAPEVRPNEYDDDAWM